LRRDDGEIHLGDKVVLTIVREDKKMDVEVASKVCPDSRAPDRFGAFDNRLRRSYHQGRSALDGEGAAGRPRVNRWSGLL
jgi:hypothetical protein